MPVIRDKITVILENGKENRQKRLLNGSLNELHTYFHELNPTSTIGFSTFAKIRPRECILSGSTGTHTMCVCMRHENVNLQIRAIKSLPMMKDTDINQMIKTFMVCDECTPNCFLLKCNNCPELNDFSNKLLSEVLSYPMESVKFKNWIRVDSFFKLVDCVKVPDEFVDDFSALFNDFLPHYFFNKSQKDFLHTLKNELGPSEAIVQADFAENYKTHLQNEIQSHHFYRTMVTINPFEIYFRVDGELLHKTLVVISPVMEHNYILVYCCQIELYKFLAKFLPNIKKTYMITDGAGSQYKNKYNFANITFNKIDFGYDTEWHFHASSHGKSSCDGVGGTSKQAAVKYSLAQGRDELIDNAKSFYDWAVK